MTISQSSSSQGSRPLAAALGRVFRALVLWRERRRVQSDLARLAQVGDYLLRDVGLDPGLARRDPSATLERMTRRRR
jgi:uncharacterized protein YjiS (DUF1127 family)